MRDATTSRPKCLYTRPALDSLVAKPAVAQVSAQWRLPSVLLELSRVAQGVSTLQTKCSLYRPVQGNWVAKIQLRGISRRRAAPLTTTWVLQGSTGHCSDALISSQQQPWKIALLVHRGGASRDIPFARDLVSRVLHCRNCEERSDRAWRKHSASINVSMLAHRAQTFHQSRADGGRSGCCLRHTRRPRR